MLLSQPGAVATGLGAHVAEDARGATTQVSGRLPRTPPGVPLARRADPSELAAVVAFLLSDDASFVTGSAVMADGGYTAI